MDFSAALIQLKAGKKVGRDSWAGKALYLDLIKAKRTKVSKEPVAGVFPPGDDVDHKPRFDLLAINGETMRWRVTEDDLLADDRDVRVDV